MRRVRVSFGRALLLIGAIGSTLYGIAREFDAHSRSLPASQARDSSEVRFRQVAKAYQDQGDQVSRFDPAHPTTLSIFLPKRVADKITPAQAQEIADAARSRLGDVAKVSVKAPDGEKISVSASF